MQMQVSRRRSALLISLGIVVILAVIARPSALVTFSLLTLASGFSERRSQRL
ncbi:hypothetical protein [Parasynechococcus sp.]|jgi:hypothetical protein|uniref:hypothetical protein n=1 Tax=Parasynechococcus sp. TaxID=3101203 RepID=UPI003704C9A0